MCLLDCIQNNDNTQGIWFGIELDEPKGKNNGTVKKKFYFSAKENCGLFVHHKRLCM